MTPERSHYLLPTDSDEIDRLNAQHRATTLLFDGLLPSEISSRIDTTSSTANHTLKILDVSCGTGIWAIELAEQCPKVHVTGFDINPMWPSTTCLPENIRFEIRNILHDIPIEHQGAYDLVHCRFLITAIRDFPALLKRLTCLLKAGGYLVLTEPELSCVSLDEQVKPEESCPYMAKLGDVSRIAMQSLGIEVDAARNIPQYLRESGTFTRITAQREYLPMSPCSSDSRLHEIGKIQLKNSLAMPIAIGALLLACDLVKPNELARLTEGYRAELMSGQGKPALPLWCVWATEI
ncbi:hypothetical protein IAU59_001882 [Kwoniella sp. CBS 9459]